MPAAQNLADLEQHAVDFAARTGFTYTVLPPDGPDTAEVLGCVYIYPPGPVSQATRRSVPGYARTTPRWTPSCTPPSGTGWPATGPSARSSTPPALTWGSGESRLGRVNGTVWFPAPPDHRRSLRSGSRCTTVI